ncbi:MAG: hypothetical protein Q9227_000430 [Pyrenula ochraceoflavens]
MASSFDPYVSALQSFYNDASERYQNQSHKFHGDGAQNLVEAAGPAIKPGGWVCDLATGKGDVAFAAAKKVGSTGRVLGIDISDGFLEHASQTTTQLGVDNFVQFIQQDIEHLALPDPYLGGQSFDVVTCGNAIALFLSPEAILRTISTKLLKPGGMFVADISGVHVPAKLFLDVAVPRGFRPPVNPAWFGNPEARFHEIFKHSAFELKAVSNKDVSADEVKWDVKDAAAIEKLWQNVALDSVWLSFGIDTLAAEVFADIKQAWIERVVEHRRSDGFIVTRLKQYIALAVLHAE